MANDLNLKEDMYSVDENFVRIKTKKLSQFVCVSCNRTCDAEIQVFLLGNLHESIGNNTSTVKMKSFLCSSLFKIADYRNVSLSLTNFPNTKLKFIEFIKIQRW